MRPRALKRRLILAGLCGVLAAASITTGVAKADVTGCESVPWGFLMSQTRTICDGPIRPDGSWDRGRMVWVPAHQVPFRCSYSSYSSSCSGGYFVDDRVISKEFYPVNPGIVLPDEPGHLVGGLA